MAIKIDDKAQEQSTFVINYSFQDENEKPATPVTMAWTLLRDGDVIVNDREAVALDVDTTIAIVLEGDDLALWTDDTKCRRILLRGMYNSTLGAGKPYADQLVFQIEDLHGIEPVDA